MRPNPGFDDELAYYTPAIEWIRSRGGSVACARDVLKMAPSGSAAAVRLALDSAGAPEMVFAILWRYVHEMTKRGGRYE